MEKKVFTFRLSEKLVEKARCKGFNLTQIFEKKLQELILQTKCPTCKQRVANKRSRK